MIKSKYRIIRYEQGNQDFRPSTYYRAWMNPIITDLDYPSRDKGIFGLVLGTVSFAIIELFHLLWLDHKEDKRIAAYWKEDEIKD